MSMSATAGSEAAPAEVLPRIYPVSSTSCLGREAQLNRILERLDIDDGERLILISGEAGMGKTRMLSELAERAFALGPEPVVVLFGSCYRKRAVFLMARSMTLCRAMSRLSLQKFSTSDFMVSSVISAASFLKSASGWQGWLTWIDISHP